MQVSKLFLAAFNEHHKENEENHVPYELKQAEDGLHPLERCVGARDKLGLLLLLTACCSDYNHADIKYDEEGVEDYENYLGDFRPVFLKGLNHEQGVRENAVCLVPLD